MDKDFKTKTKEELLDYIDFNERKKLDLMRDLLEKIGNHKELIKVNAMNYVYKEKLIREHNLLAAQYNAIFSTISSSIDEDETKSESKVIQAIQLLTWS